MGTIPENNGNSREPKIASGEGKNRYRSLLNILRESIVEIDANWQIIFANDRFIEMSGYVGDEIIGKSIFDIVNKNRLPSLKKQFNLRKQGDTNSYIVELLTVDNSEILKTVFQNPYFDSKGNFRGEFGVIFDIRPPELPAEKFRSKKAIYQFLAENMGDIVWTLDVDLNTVYVSPSVENVLGFTPEERKQQKIEDMMTPESIERITAVYLDALQVDQDGSADPNRHLTVEVEYYHRNGTTVWLENMIKAHRDEAGKIIGVYGVSRDITKRKLAEERIIQANEEKEKLIAELQKSLANIKTLKGLLPICASCKKIRDDMGYWNQIESYFDRYSDVEFSHGICPECAKKIYPEYDLY